MAKKKIILCKLVYSTFRERNKKETSVQQTSENIAVQIIVQQFKTFYRHGSMTSKTITKERWLLMVIASHVH